MTPDSSFIALRNICKSYGRVQVTHDVSLEIPAGEFVVILGPSGCGKSTLLRMIAGLEDITAGEIAIDGQVVNAIEPRARGCAMVFQNYALYPHMSVAENIGYALKVAGVSKAERAARIAKVAQTIGLTDYLDRKPAQLSGGQRQRVAMGRAMIREPRVFLFDEPLSNLDAKLRVQMRVEIRKLHNRLGTTSVFVTHDQIEAMTLADRLVVMNAGRVEQVGTPSEVYRSPASLFVAGFIGSPPMNLLPCTASGADAVTIGSYRIPTGPHGQPVGQKLVLGIRPEDVGFGVGEMAMEIEFSEELGAARLYHGHVADAEFILQVTGAQGKVPGETRFSLPAASLHLFDAQTGARLAAPSSGCAVTEN
jgi:sn-glycerol 3-phosphate transport system ATP-binding protein